MQTLYIDVYFLINFTVDFIALYFAVTFAKVPSGTRRLLFGALIGALCSVLYVLSPEKAYFKLLVSVIGLFLLIYVATKKISLVRRLKTLVSFLLFSALLGGAVNYIYGILDKYLYGYFKGEAGGAENRRLLLFSVIVLLSIGVFKMIVSFFSNIECDGSCEIEISVLGKTERTEAFVDTGNLAVDPMDMRPILFIKKDLAERIIPKSVIDLSDPDTLEKETRKRIRLIPISKGDRTQVLTGFKADSVSLVTKKGREEISVTLAIDKEGGDYGGYNALLPAAVFNNGK